MENLRLKKNSKYFIRILTFFVALSVSVTITLTYITNSLYTKTTIRDITSISEEMLSRSSYYSQLVYQLVMSFISEVYYSSDMITYLNLTESNLSVEFKLYTELNKRKNSYPFIHSVYLYNGRFDHIIGTDISSRKTSECEDRELISALKNGLKSNYTIFPRKLSLRMDTLQENVLTLIYTDSRSTVTPGNEIQNAVVVNINESYFRKQVQTAYSLKNTDMFILDSNGIVLSHVKDEEFMKDYSSQSYVQTILTSKDPRGSFTYWLNGHKYLISYVSNPELHWKVVNLVPYNSIMESPNKLQNQIIFICVIILCISLLLSGLISKHLYNPINRLVTLITGDSKDHSSLHSSNEIEFISQIYSEVRQRAKELYSQNQSNIVLLREEYLKNLLVHETTCENVQKHFEQYQIPLDIKDLKVVVLELDYYSVIKDSYKAAYNIGIASTVSDIINSDFRHTVIPLWEGEFAIILNQEDQSSKFEQLIILLHEIQKEIKAVYGYSLSIGVGETVSHLSEICYSYRQASEFLRYKIIHGPECIIYSKWIAERTELGFQYPEDIEKAIIRAIKLNKRSDFYSDINKLLEQCSRYTWQNFYQVIAQIAQSCIKSIEKIDQDPRIQSFSDPLKAIQSFKNMNSQNEVRKWFSDLFSHHETIVQEIEDAKSSSSRSGEAIEKALEYIRHNYSDPSLSLDSLSAMVNLSPSYFSKVFKDNTNTNLPDYIGEFRLEYAMSLLKDSEMNITDIAIQSGFININYFYYVFKKHMGLTPSGYRTAARSQSK